MKVLIKIVVLAIVFGSVYSCQKKTRPNYQFMPNMYEPVGYETYGEYDVFPGEQSAMLPADGTIARGFSLYDYENTNEAYEMAKVELKNPLDSTQIDMARGKELYEIYCGICHGNKGDGQGNLVKREKILGVPSYDDEGRAITEGSIYHVIYYGRNAMGSYAAQLNEEERWQVTAYVLQLKEDLK
ncbi:MAG: cytochrome c [Bacteroidia bacterium]|nr:cytochrome c [Bacteroidia bacterium]NND25000.1 cytochrome c [Flavobacteriaceae bacterium]MBT8278580.1 cytochrome c [Bacteroidia bacterium]NNK59526.1 cytochrome c [Flavobacteriaceae bacterium]NNL32606.1 cytochrome c [Flavobacteriaceae bacterium]